MRGRRWRNQRGWSDFTEEVESHLGLYEEGQRPAGHLDQHVQGVDVPVALQGFKVMGIVCQEHGVCPGERGKGMGAYAPDDLEQVELLLPLGNGSWEQGETLVLGSTMVHESFRGEWRERGKWPEHPRRTKTALLRWPLWSESPDPCCLL